MKATINYVPTFVGPSKLDQILAEAPELNDESMEKVCIIEDIVALGKIMTIDPPESGDFDYMYDLPLKKLEDLQYHTQVMYNTWKMKAGIW